LINDISSLAFKMPVVKSKMGLFNENVQLKKELEDLKRQNKKFRLEDPDFAKLVDLSDEKEQQKQKIDELNVKLKLEIEELKIHEAEIKSQIGTMRKQKARLCKQQEDDILLKLGKRQRS